MHVEQVRSFNRTVTERIGALQDSYLASNRPLGADRVLWEIGRASMVQTWGLPTMCRLFLVSYSQFAT